MGALITLPPILVAIGIIVGGAIVGFLYFVGIVGKEKSDDIKTAKDAAEFVTDALEKKIKILEQNVSEQADRLSLMGNKLEQLIGENKGLKDLLQGRDENTQKFQSVGFEVMSTTIPTLLEVTMKTNKNVERLAQAIEKHLMQTEKKQVVTVTTGLSNGTA